MRSAKDSRVKQKTNAARLLDGLGIAYELKLYEVDPDDLSVTNVARKIGLPTKQVFKTLLTVASTGEHYFAVVPGDRELDLKKMAAVVSVKQLELESLKKVEPLTGYVRGGVTVLAAKKAFTCVADYATETFDVISVSAGARGTQLILAPADYLRATSALLADIGRDSGERIDLA